MPTGLSAQAIRALRLPVALRPDAPPPLAAPRRNADSGIEPGGDAVQIGRVARLRNDITAGRYVADPSAIAAALLFGGGRRTARP